MLLLTIIYKSGNVKDEKGLYMNRSDAETAAKKILATDSEAACVCMLDVFSNQKTFITS